MKTYTAQVGPDNADRLATIGAEAEGDPTIEDIGEGTVQINDLDQLRGRATGEDASITDDEDGLQIWIDGESYPVFDDLDAAVADAFGVQTHYDEAKRNYDRLAAEWTAVVAKVVELAGSTKAAADLLEMEEPAVTAIVAPAPETPATPEVAPPGAGSTGAGPTDVA